MVWYSHLLKSFPQFVVIHTVKGFGVVNKAKESQIEVAQLCLTVCDPMDCSLPGSSVHEIFQARVVECVAISFSRGSSRLRDRTRVSRIGGGRFNL